MQSLEFGGLQGDPGCIQQWFLFVGRRKTSLENVLNWKVVHAACLVVRVPQSCPFKFGLSASRFGRRDGRLPREVAMLLSPSTPMTVSGYYCSVGGACVGLVHSPTLRVVPCATRREAPGNAPHRSSTKCLAGCGVMWAPRRSYICKDHLKERSAAAHSPKGRWWGRVILFFSFCSLVGTILWLNRGHASQRGPFGCTRCILFAKRFVRRRLAASQRTPGFAKNARVPISKRCCM